MNEPRDDLDRLLQPPVDPLAPPSGTFARVRRAARRRHWARAAMSASAAVLVVAAAVPGTLSVLQARDERPAGPPAVRSASTPSAAHSPSPTVTATGDAAPGTGGSRVGPPGGPVPPGFAPESVTFVSRRLGWAIGQAPCSDPPCTSVVRTADGGRGWVGIPAPRTGGGDRPGGVSDLRFADARNGWAYGPGLWSTHDGGASWGRVGAPGGGRVLALAAAGGRVVAAVSTCGKDPNCDSVRVYGAPAGSDRWRPLPGAQAPTRGGVSLTVRGGTAYVVGGPSVLVAGPIDGGAEWTTRPMPCADDAAGASIASARGGELVLVCAGRPGAGGQRKRAYVSGDGGRSWNRGGQAPPGGLVTSVAATAAKMFVATNHGLLVSASDGREWRRDLAGRSLAYVGFTTSRQGVLVTTGGARELLFTYDAGQTWSAARFR